MKTPLSAQLSSAACLQLSRVYNLLSQLWSSEVTLEQLQTLNEPDLRGAIEHLGGSVPSEVSSETVETLAVDYCQLLIGPKDQLPPVESIWAGGQFQTTTASSVKQYYDLLPGFKPAATIPDHIGAQLEFMAHLFQNAAMNDNPEVYTETADRFFEKHLAWTSDFLRQAHEKAETDFYQGLARITQFFLNENAKD